MENIHVQVADQQILYANRIVNRNFAKETAGAMEEALSKN